MEAMNGGKIISVTKELIEGIEKEECKSELLRLTTLQRVMRQMIEIYLSVDTVRLIVDSIWKNSIEVTLTPYDVVYKLAVYQDMIRQYLEEALPAESVIKLTGKSLFVSYCILLHYDLLEAASEVLKRNWLLKQFVCSLYKLIKWKKVSRSQIIGWLSPDRRTVSRKYATCFYANVAYSKQEPEAKVELLNIFLEMCGMTRNETENCSQRLKTCCIKDFEDNDEDFRPEQKILCQLMKKIGVSANVRLQMKLQDSLGNRVIPVVNPNEYIRDLFRNWLKTRILTPKEERMIKAISFLYNDEEVSAEVITDHSEFVLDFLIICENLFNSGFKLKQKCSKYNKIILFTQTWQMILKMETISTFFLDAVILKAVAVYKMLIEDEDIVELAVKGLNLLAQVIPPDDYVLKYVDCIIPAIALSFFFHSKSPKKRVLVKELEKCLEYLYQCAPTNEMINKIQFLKMSKFSQDSHICQLKAYNEFMFRIDQSQERSLNEMLDYLPNADIYSQNLILLYLNDIISSSKESDPLYNIHKLIKEMPELEMKICRNVFRINKSYTMNKLDITVAQACARCIQLLGPGVVSSYLDKSTEKVWMVPSILLDKNRDPFELGEQLLAFLQHLAFKVTERFHHYIGSIWQLKCLLYVDSNSDLKKKIPERLNNCFYFSESGNYDKISRKLKLYFTQNTKRYSELVHYKTESNLKFLCLYLITRISDSTVRSIFEAIESTIRTDNNILMDIVPILIYLSFFYSLNSSIAEIVRKDVQEYICEVLEGPIAAHKRIIFYTLDFLKKVKTQEYSKVRNEIVKVLKNSVNEGELENPTSSGTRDYIESHKELKLVIETNKLIQELIRGIPRLSLIRAAKSIRAYKVALYYFEEECRNRTKDKDLQYLFWVLNREELDLLIDIYGNVNKEDIKSEYLSSIIKPSEAFQYEIPEKSGVLVKEKYIISCWKTGQWDNLLKTIEPENISELIKNEKEMIDFSFSDTISLSYIARVLSQIYKLVHICSSHNYRQQYDIVIGYIKFIEKEIMIDLCGASTTSVYIHSFYLCLLYDIRQLVELTKHIVIESGFLKISDLTVKQSEAFTDPSFSKQFEDLYKVFKDREHRLLDQDKDQLKTLYFTHHALFDIVNHKVIAAYYTEQLAVLMCKNKDNVLDAYTFFKQCEPYKEFIPDYELQYGKLLNMLATDYQAAEYLTNQMSIIESKAIQAEKNLKQSTRIFERSQLYLIRLCEKMRPDSKEIREKYENLLKMKKGSNWEKAYVSYAKYLEKIYVDTDDIEYQVPIMYNYLKSLEYGYKYVWQSLPNALNIWFELNTPPNTPKEEVNKVVRLALLQMDLYKIATAVPLLISRYGHPSPEVINTIQDTLTRLIVEYPLQNSWWIMNYYTFKKPRDKPAVMSEEDKETQRKMTQGIHKPAFARGILEKVKCVNARSYKKIMQCEATFTALREFTEKNVSSKHNEISPELQKVPENILIIPIREFLFPRLPPPNASEEQIKKHSVYKENPITIKSFSKKFQLIPSKESPKKIEIIGSDSKLYTFLLKYDKLGDLSKEARFINVIEMINQILRTDKECSKRDLKLITYSITNLSSSTAIIEWIDNIEQLKSIIVNAWRELGLYGDFHDIKGRNKRRDSSQTVANMWHKIMEEFKPVLYKWFLNVFDDCESWFNAKLNFTRTHAVWSITGYLMGLGDRHGGNILINNRSGEIANVDFDCIFGKGRKLTVPEIVPFRLTRNIIDAFGIFREKAEFTITCNVVLKALCKHKDNFLSNLQTFVHDPLFEHAKNNPIIPKNAIEQVKANLMESEKDTQGHIQRLIYQATSHENLKRMYIGWMPWVQQA